MGRRSVPVNNINANTSEEGSMIHVIATIEIEPGKRAAFLQIFNAKEFTE